MHNTLAGARMSKPEEDARKVIDAKLIESGWVLQDFAKFNPMASFGVAVREFMSESGPIDYLLFIKGKPIGLIEAKASKYGNNLFSVEQQAERYRDSPLKYAGKIDYKLRFVYISTGNITYYVDYCDEKARCRKIFSFHRPESLEETLMSRDTFRNGLRNMPELASTGLRACQFEAIKNLETSLSNNKPRSLIQMATGAGKTYAAITSTYRLLKHANAKRILFMVDTRNLGKQANDEFFKFRPQDDSRLFPELYSVSHLNSSYITTNSQVYICTIQRLYSILTNTSLDESIEDDIQLNNILNKKDKQICYNAKCPPEFFNLIIIDECHRSIYNKWKQVLEYFDAFLVGLTATPDKRTFGFFNENVVSEYSREKAIIDNVNVGSDVYLIETNITTNGAKIVAAEVEKRERLSRKERWEQIDEPIEYQGTDLDRSIVNLSQIRTIIRECKRIINEEAFKERKEIPKTLIFAKDDGHAEDIVRIVREEFDEGNEFCRKITYRADNPEGMINSFRNDYYPRIAVTVDMIATGTDIKPIECLIFMRDVRSRNYFEQMSGRGTRTLSRDELRNVTPSATSNKTRYVLIDAVGVTKSVKTETRNFERKPGVSLKELMMLIAMGNHDEDTLTSLAGRLTRIQNAVGKKEIEQIEAVSSVPMNNMIENLLRPFDKDYVEGIVSGEIKLDSGDDTSGMTVNKIKEELIIGGTKPFYKPNVRDTILEIRKLIDQVIDTENMDVVTSSKWDADNTANAELAIDTFKQFIQDNIDEIQALGIFYNQPYKGRGSLLKGIKALYSKMLENGLTTDRLWNAYSIKRSCAQRSAKSELTDIISMIRYELNLTKELNAFSDIVNYNFKRWTFARNAGAVHFTDEQMEWLRMIKEHITTSLTIEIDDFDYTPFDNLGGRGAFVKLFPDYSTILGNLNKVLVQ